MAGTLKRFAAPLALLTASLIGAGLVFGNEAEEVGGRMLYFPAAQTAGILLWTAASALAAAWWVARTPRSTTGRGCALSFAVLGLVAGAAIGFDLLWATVGPGVDPVRDVCGGGMDCIGKPRPSAPLTGEGWLLIYYTWFVVVPGGLLLLMSLMERASSRPSAPVG